MIIAIIQARLGSTRLPGKVLKEIKGKPLLLYVVERVKMARVAKVIIACPSKDAKDIMSAVGNYCHVYGWGGPENDVLGRFQDTLRTYASYSGCEEFVRICSDSPFIDPTIINYVYAAHEVSHPLRTSVLRGKAFVTTNTEPRTFPAGQCVEISDIAGFLTGNKIGRVGRGKEAGDALTDSDREHVFPWYKRNCPTVNVTCPTGNFADKIMTVDTQEDFDRTEEIVKRMGREHWAYSWRDILEMMR